MSESETMAPIGTALNFEGLSQVLAKLHSYSNERWGRGSGRGICFRGTSDHLYGLNPGLLRDPYPHTDSNGLACVEKELWCDFSLRSKALLGNQISKPLEAMLIMQQHGFPTRLLDWSSSLAVAAYFAVRDGNEEEDGAIWIMEPIHLMRQRGLTGWCSMVGEEPVDELGLRVNTDHKPIDDGHAEWNKLTPMVVKPHHMDLRISAQKVIYTLHTFTKNSLESLAEDDKKTHNQACFLHKIIIPYDRKADLRDELQVLTGISEDSLFPDMDGFARSYKLEAYRKAELRSEYRS